MVNKAFDDEEKPLDPAVLRVQARLRRLMLIAGLTLGLGILAVLGAVVYKLSTYGDKTPAVALSPAVIPAGGRLVSAVSANNRLVLTYERPAGTTLIFVDPRSEAVVGRLDLRPQTGDSATAPQLVPSSP